MRLPPNRQDISCMTSKKSPNVYKKWPNTDFTRKMKYFDTPLTYCLKMWQFGQNNCCHRLRKVAQSAMNRPIWSHWTSATSLSIIINTFLHWSFLTLLLLYPPPFSILFPSGTFLLPLSLFSILLHSDNVLSSPLYSVLLFFSS